MKRRKERSKSIAFCAIYHFYRNAEIECDIKRAEEIKISKQERHSTSEGAWDILIRYIGYTKKEKIPALLREKSDL